MATTREFLNQMDDYNNRVHEAEKTLRQLQSLHEVLRNQAGDYMRLGQFDAEIATFTFPKFTFPEGFKPAEPTPARPTDKAAE